MMVERTQGTAGAGRLPVLAVTMGDPAGVGPEIAVKALLNPEVRSLARCVIFGDPFILSKAVSLVSATARINPISDIDEANFDADAIDVLGEPSIDVRTFRFCEVSAEAGEAAFKAVLDAIRLAMDGKVDATVTGPINKESLHKAGRRFSGHTEIYAHYTNTKDYSMMLAEGDLRVVHVSTHVSLRRACELVTKERVLSVIKLADTAMREFGIKRPRIGVAGLNPHASDGGLFGTEERDEIIPAIKAAQTLGILAEGPVPPDSLYPKVAGGFYDIAVAMYHDQGHIPVKMAGFVWDREKGGWKSVKGVNITLGLPIIRTSVDHGTAFDQAWKGTANEESMIEAIRYAAAFADRK